MNLFNQLSELLDLDFWFDQEEDLDRPLDQLLVEIETALSEAKKYVAAVVAAERLLARELEQTNSAIERWRTKARQLRSSGDEAESRRAVLRKRELEASAKRLSGQHATARQTSEALKAALVSLEMRISEARRKYHVMLAREKITLRRINLRRRLVTGGAATLAERIAHLEAELDAVEDELWPLVGYPESGF